ncbi:MAG: hypothetical protein SNJ72_10880, partial [Fimbriimonadales bacterium]
MLKERHGMGWLLMLGGAMMLLGFLITGITCLGGIVNFTRHGDPSLLLIAWLGVAVAVAGILIMAGVFGYGIWLDRNRFKGPQTTLNPVYVVATYVVDRTTQETVSYWREYPVEQLRFFVRLRLPNRRDDEFECAPELFSSVGEGMMGEAVVQGNWLCSFKPMQTEPREL